MCAIVDSNVVHEVFGPNQPPAGQVFYEWINAANGRFVVGGKQLEELKRASPDFREWASVFAEAGRMRIVNEDLVNTKAEDIMELCISNDSHIIALAQISGARLLYTNENPKKSKSLCKDFKNKQLINRPEGKIYSTREFKNVTQTHKKLLRRRDLC